MIGVDHGTGLVTRRGHGSQSNVRQGDVVARGQRLPLWAAWTLDHAASHCEVRLNGVPQNPARYLQASG
jgi:murein DD-endopeptidase MepM/ murein hydrolase activator NlpD